MAIDKLLQRIEQSDVSEAAKVFYREHLSKHYSVTGSWGCDYALIKELDDAGLIQARLVYLDDGADF